MKKRGQSPHAPSDRDTTRTVLAFASALTVAGMGLLFLMIIAFALPVFAEGGAGGPFSWKWSPAEGLFGILPMLVGSLALAGLAVVTGWPLGLALCCWLLCPDMGGPRRLRVLIAGMVRLMTAVPTVVYGFAAVFLLTPVVRAALGGTGMSWLTAGLMLGLLVLPTVVLVLNAGLGPRLERLTPGGQALGMSRLDMLATIVLPSAAPTLVSSIVLAFGRAVGDTLLPLMLAGNAPQTPEHLGSSLRALTAHMAMVTANEVGGAAYHSLFAAGAILLAINAAAGMIARRLERLARDPDLPDGPRIRSRRAGRRGPSAPPRFSGRVPLRLLAWLSALLVPAAVAVLLGYILWRGLPAFGPGLFFGRTPPLQALTGLRPVWDGIWPACAGTLCLVGLTLCLAIFPGVGCGLYLSEYAAPARRRRIGAAVDILAGMPSIVMGLFGFSLILLLRRTLFPTANTGLFLAALCLALLVLPVLVVTTREAMAAVPPRLRLAATAVGLTPARRLLHVLLPSAVRGIGGGVMLALGRAAEDTAVIMFTGVVANAGLPAGLGRKFEALSFNVYYTAAQYQDQEELTRGFGAAAVLLILAALLLAGARALENGCRRGAGWTAAGRRRREES